jgi:hypothetical protein
MYDVSHYYGSDLQASATGDLLVADVTTTGRLPATMVPGLVVGSVRRSIFLKLSRRSRRKCSWNLASLRHLLRPTFN